MIDAVKGAATLACPFLSPASRVRAMATVLADEGRASYRHITPVRFSLRQPVQQRGSTCRCLVQ